MIDNYLIIPFIFFILYFIIKNTNLTYSLIDKDFKNVKAMKEIQKSWNIELWEIKKQEVGSYLKSTNETFDFIFADPPYDAPKLNSLPGLCIPKLKSPGILVLEHQPNIKFDISPTSIKEYGSTVCSIFVKSE